MGDFRHVLDVLDTLQMQRKFKAAEQRLNDKVKERLYERSNATAVA